MKPRSDGRRLEGSLTGRKIGLTLDQDATQHLMGVLTDLYSDPELAVIREYATNALDSHVQAGSRAPILVTTPTSLAPVFTVEDHGLGLSEEDLEHVYTRYGASTKRGTDDATGMLGLGCKAALTYADQFTLTATKDGVRVIASVTRTADGGGELTVVQREETDAPNGVRIQVPVEARNGFKRKAEALFRYWEPGTVLLDGEDPACSREEAKVRISDDIYLEKCVCDFDRRRHLLVQGGVSYPANIGYYGLPNTVRVVAHVPIGTVHFTPSREGLLDTPATRDAQEELTAKVREGLAQALAELIDAADSRVEALRQLPTVTKFGVGYSELTYRGEALPATWDAPKAFAQGAKSANKVRLSPDQLPRVVRVENFRPGKLAKPHRDKLAAWYAETFGDLPRGFGERPIWVLLDPGTSEPSYLTPWLDPERVVDWTSLKSKPGTKSKPSDRFTVYDDGHWNGDGLGPEDLDGEEVLYILPHGERPSRYETHPDVVEREKVALLQETHPDAWIMRVQRNREAKFLRLVPHAEEGWPKLKAAAQEWLDGLSEQEVKSLRRKLGVGRWRGDHFYWWHALNPDEIDDPDLVAAIEAERVQAETKDTTAEHVAEWNRWIRYVRLALPGEDEDPCEELDARYPLVDWRNGDLDPHVTLYVNAAYRAAQD